MKQVDLEQRKIDPQNYLRKSACESDTSKIINEPGVYCVAGKPTIIYGRLGERYDRMLWAVKTIGFSKEMRSSTGGHLTRGSGKTEMGQSRIFGLRPRIPIGANYCSVASSYATHPEQHRIICEFGRLLDSIYSNFAPTTAGAHSDSLRKTIRAEWIIPGTRFTSGIVNQNNPLRYHFDKGNLHGVMSAMIVFRDLCKGGYLSVPEFDARFDLSDHSFLLFDGQSYLHGVTAIDRLNKRSYRYSVVYYALRGMAKCGTLEEEVARARIEKREREKRRI